MTLSLLSTPVEEFFLLEDLPAFPMGCFVRLRMSGVLNRTAFESAVQKALPRHPLLSSRIESSSGKRPCWIHVSEAQPEIEWHAGPIEERFPSVGQLDLSRELGLRFHVVSDGIKSDLTINFHHACCDALGMMDFAHDLLIAYAQEIDSHNTKFTLPAIDINSLEKRGTLSLTPSRFLFLLPKQIIGLLRAIKFLRRRPVPVILHDIDFNETTLPDDYPTAISRFFNVEQTSRLRQAARDQRVTLNDLLASGFLIALRDWRLQAGISSPGSWLRMVVPLNMRTNKEVRIPAANFVSMGFLDRMDSDLETPERLLRSIHREMGLIKRCQLGFTFPLSLAICKWLPGGLQRYHNSDKCYASCTFTNLGHLFSASPLQDSSGHLVAGNVTVEKVEAFPPNRPYLWVTLVVLTYANALTVTLHYDPRPVSAERAATLIELYVALLEDMI